MQRDKPPQKISKLSIAAETEEDRYEISTKVICYGCNQDQVETSSDKLSQVVDEVLKAATFARREEVKAWEQEHQPCDHTVFLQQGGSRNIDSQDLGHCSMCDLKENLWLCLQCGNLGCGREQKGGLAGNSHALAHANTMSHHVTVKLGSITPEGDADVYCYACDEERTDSNLAKHLSHWGINIADRKKTEKSLTEMQIEQNLGWEFSMTTEDGKELKPLFGPDLTGMKNLGNSCYLNSIVQCLFALPNFQARYHHPGEEPPMTEKPAEDLETQLRKMADGLLSGRYSRPDTDVIASEHTAENPYQKGLAPAMLKYLIGRGHAEFSTMRQQDAHEFLLHLFKLISRSAHPPSLPNPTTDFSFVMEQRLQCMNCKRVRYRTDEQDNISVRVPARKIEHPSSESTESNSNGKEKDQCAPVTLEECLDIFTGEDAVQLRCPACGSDDGFTTRILFKTFPEVLVVNARRFQLVNWVPTKLDIPVVVDEKPLRLDRYRSTGLQTDEEALPDEVEATTKFVPDTAALAQLVAMGFPPIRSEKALHATGNRDAEAAMNWLFAHMEDPDIDDPVDLTTGSNSGAKGGDASEDPEKIEMLGAMGFPASRARTALRETGGDTERAVDWLFNHADDPVDEGDGVETIEADAKPKSMPGNDPLPANFQLHSIVCHKGASIHAGHYVAFIRKRLEGESEDSWVLFNDEKVVQAVNVNEMKKFAYVYFFRRV
ncbi:MAG: hypothetical protein M1816_001350 [Peltula sp. TS41687]|nr:MAG: hypothetical protein M1816_001350 [Peltula sp. TS41687]